MSISNKNIRDCHCVCKEETTLSIGRLTKRIHKYNDIVLAVAIACPDKNYIVWWLTSLVYSIFAGFLYLFRQE